MIPIPTLETDRLRLRPFALSDAADVQFLAGDRAISDTTGNVPHPYEDGMAEEWISTHEQLAIKREAVTFAVICKSDSRLVGAISLLHIAVDHRAELGYWIGKPYWGQGYCTESAQEVLRYAFTELSLLRVHARCLGRNSASGRVLEKVGMQHEGTRRRHEIKRGTVDDVELFGILREEWVPIPE